MGIIPKIHEEIEPTMAPILYIGLYYVLDCDYLILYEVGINDIFSVIGQCVSHSGFPLDILKHFDKIHFKAGLKDNL